MRDGSGVELTIAGNNGEIAIDKYFKHPCAQTESVIQSQKGVLRQFIHHNKKSEARDIQTGKGLPSEY